MKKALKIIGIIILILLVLIAALLWAMKKAPAAPTDYQTKVKTGGEIEATYMKDGKYGVSEVQQPAFQSFSPYTIYYPDEMIDSAQTWPVIVLCNGTGTPLSKYPAVAKHYASWGFIVIGTEEEFSWNGFGAEMCARHLILLNNTKEFDEDKPNIFYHKINLEDMGVVGHSQGGVGVFSTITNQPHKNLFKAAVSLSPTNQEGAQKMEWDYDVSKIKIPILLISGAGGGDDWVVTGEQLESIYNDITSDKIMMRRKDTPHGEVLYSEDGYVTAWFMWQLRGDQEAAKAFLGPDAEILKNPLYQDQKVDVEIEVK